MSRVTRAGHAGHAGGPARPLGFTLIEVLIALAIVSIALAAFVRLTSQTTGNLGLVEAKSLAMLSAQNCLNELQMDALPPPGQRRMPCPQADQAFVCDVTIGAAEGGLRSVSIAVRADRAERGDGPLATLATRIAEKQR